MKNIHSIVSSAVVTAIALGALSGPAAAADKMDSMEKCYGVAKAGKNDCKTMTNACAGHSTADGQKDAFIALPAGSCERIVGGSTMAPAH